jgi:hypothetical protein
MAKEPGHKRLPPYVSYRTFLNFVDRLQQGIPARVDRSYWSDRLSGSNGTQLMSALRFLGLIDANAIPSQKLRLLVTAKGVQKTELLRQITSDAFGFLLQGSFDTQTATYAQLDEVFQNNFELTESVRRKCVKFFVALASDAGITLSPFITKRLRSSPGSNGTKQTVKRKGAKVIRNVAVPLDRNKVQSEMSWDKMLLAKFPTFDPTWSDEVKLGWLEAFDGLKFPTFDTTWSDELKLQWFKAYDKLLEREFPRNK